MKLQETIYDNTETGCCARLDVARWDERTVEWHEKPFLRDHVREVLHIPVNFGRVITRAHETVEAAEAYPEEPLTLAEEVSLWRSDLYMAVDRDVPGASIERLSGTFLTKVFEGPYRHVGKWVEQMKEYVRQEGRDLKKIYFWYATCPKCAKVFDENRVVLFAQFA